MSRTAASASASSGEGALRPRRGSESWAFAGAPRARPRAFSSATTASHASSGLFSEEQEAHEEGAALRRSKRARPASYARLRASSGLFSGGEEQEAPEEGAALRRSKRARPSARLRSSGGAEPAPTCAPAQPLPHAAAAGGSAEDVASAAGHVLLLGAGGLAWGGSSPARGASGEGAGGAAAACAASSGEGMPVEGLLLALRRLGHAGEEGCACSRA